MKPWHLLLAFALLTIAIALGILVAAAIAPPRVQIDYKISPKPQPSIIIKPQGCGPWPTTEPEGCPGICSQANTTRPRARDVGVPFEGTTGPLNAITDVPGVLVGHSTVICGDDVRTGVTAILPRGLAGYPVSAGFYSLSGNGELNGRNWIEESGCLAGPVLTTSTANVGTANDALQRYAILHEWDNWSWYDFPVVAETWGHDLDNISKFSLEFSHVNQALECADDGPVAEGSVGGGTGMRTFKFKAGIGSASRVISFANQTYMVGAIVQSNYGNRVDMLVAGAPVGIELENVLLPTGENARKRQKTNMNNVKRKTDGSFIGIIATNASLTSTAMWRIAKRASLGYGRDGGYGHTSSGDLFLAFSTGGVCTYDQDAPMELGTEEIDLDPFFEAAVQSIDEATINSMLAADTMVGVGGTTFYGLPASLLQPVLKKYNRCNC